MRTKTSNPKPGIAPLAYETTLTAHIVEQLGRLLDNGLYLLQSVKTSIRRIIALAVIVSAIASAAALPIAAAEKIDINTADELTLQELDGIGPILAARIVAFREGKETGPDGKRTADHGFKPGRFEKPSDLIHVRGIGKIKYEDNKDRITVSQPASQ